MACGSPLDSRGMLPLSSPIITLGKPSPLRPPSLSLHSFLSCSPASVYPLYLYGDASPIHILTTCAWPGPDLMSTLAEGRPNEGHGITSVRVPYVCLQCTMSVSSPRTSSGRTSSGVLRSESDMREPTLEGRHKEHTGSTALKSELQPLGLGVERVSI